MHYISNILHGDISIKSNNIKGSKENTNGNFDPNDISGMTINGQTFNIKNITGYSKEIMKLTGHLKTLKSASEDVKIPEIKAPEIKTPETKITGYRGSINNNTENINPNTNSINLWDMIKSKIQQVIPFVRQFKQQIQQVGGSKELELVKYKISEVEEKLENAKEGKIHLNTKEIIEAEAELERLNNKKDKLEKGGKGNFFSSFFSSLKKITPSINNISGITIKIRNQIKQWNGGIKNGLGHVLKYVGALVSLRSIYSALSGSAQSWLGSQNKGAQQLSADIEYMKYAMGSVFAPVIQYVTSLVYQLMKAIQSVVYAMSGVNIFAKATASSMKNTSSSAKQASKSLSSVHSEINNVSDNNSSNRDVTTSPSIDLSQMDNQMSSFGQKLYEFFKPLKESWDNYGSQVIEKLKTTAEQMGGLISFIWKSFENIITNGTAYSILENILAIIGNISEAIKNAWQNNANGDAIVQNLANAFNNLLEVIKKITQSTIFQWFLDVGVLAIEKLTEAVEWVTQKVDEFVGFLTGSNDELDGWAIVVGSIATAIGLVVAALGLYNIVAGIAAVVTAVLTSPITLVVLAIAALIAIIVLCVKHWNTIKETMIKVATTIKEKVITAFNNMKDKISTIFNTIKTTIVNIWNGIWNGIKNIINKILGGIESFVNGTIKGINKLLSGISKVANAIGSFIGLNPISLQIRTISLPRLAKGGVLTEATAVVAGEYSGAKSNPEIVTPQNIMRDTFEDVLSDFASLDNNDRQINLTINVGNKKLGQILLDDLRDKTRRTGKDIEALIGG
nr:MAG TPA: minor tail protein [Caudoviricetes sp.]